MSKKGSYLFKQGEKASCFFIIDKGSVAVEVEAQGQKKQKQLGKKASFGELALLYNAPRSASIMALEDTYFWAIDRKTFRTVSAVS